MRATKSLVCWGSLRDKSTKKNEKEVSCSDLVEAEAKNQKNKEGKRKNECRAWAGQQKQFPQFCFRKVVFKVGIPQGVAFSISYIEADRELSELVLALAELPN